MIHRGFTHTHTHTHSNAHAHTKTKVCIERGERCVHICSNFYLDKAEILRNTGETVSAVSVIH